MDMFTSYMVILRSPNQITDFLMILAWAIFTTECYSQEAKSDFCTFRVHAVYICISGITGKVKLFRL